YEAWPLDNSLSISEEPDSGEITGLMTQRSWLHVLCENRVYAISTVRNPLLDGDVRPRTNRGCINNRCWVQVEQTAYMLDYLGIHAFAGNSDDDVSTPAVQDMFRSNPAGPWKINWAAKRNFHAVYSPGDDTIRWFICLGGSYTPNHALCYHLRLGRWWIEEYPWPVASSVLGWLGGSPTVFLGTNGNRFMAFGQGTLDGPSNTGGTVRGTVTSAGVDWITDSAASFASSGLVGNSVSIVRGRGKGQRRIVYSVSSGRISVTIPWTIQPDTTSTYQLGGVVWKWQSSWLRWADDQYQSVRAFSVQSKPTPANATLDLRVYRDMAETPQSDWTPAILADQDGIGHLK
ncbi:MAG: hypothetical protein ACREJC_16190, partial [Tepidisphaeraceae bacterium]